MVRRIIIVVLSILALATLVLSLWSYRETVSIVKRYSGIASWLAGYTVELSAGHLIVERDRTIHFRRASTYDYRWGGFALSRAVVGHIVRPNASEHTTVTIPAWAFLVLFAGYPMFALYRRLPNEGRRVGRCRHCGYDLTGLPSPRCPECGRAFDPVRVHAQRARYLTAARRAAERLEAYRTSRLRSATAAIAVPGTIVCAILWVISSVGLTYRSATHTLRLSQGNLMIYARPSPDVTQETGWSVDRNLSFSTVWWRTPFTSGATFYLPVCTGTVLFALVWGLVYRPLFRLRWRGVAELDSVKGRDVDSGPSACRETSSA